VTINNTDHPTKLQTFLAGKGDAATIFSEGELPVIRKQDPGARFFPYSQVFQMYGLGLVVSESTITQRPAAVRAAVKAVLDAEIYALDHPEECVDAIVKAYPNKTFDRAIELERLKEHQKLLVAAGRDKIGQMTDERWRTLEGIIVQYFNIAASGQPMTYYYTNEFLPKG
jgi:ABC-type nitrate/sulfonate/bicarbonate transport system substrate-binding protein